MSRVMSSEYMRWAKTCAHANYDLANSGVVGYSLADLPVHIEDLEINGTTYYGYEPLQKAIAKKCAVSADCVVATNGASLGNFLALAATLDPGDEVIIEHPTYELFVDIANHLGANVKRFSRKFDNQFRIELSEIEKNISPQTRLIVITNLHNPTSALTDKETLSELGALARSVNARVLVGEIYFDALFENAPSSAFHLGSEFLVTNSLTKIYGLSGLRCGWILAKPELAEKIWFLNDLVANIPPHVAERLSCIALANLDSIRERSRKILSTNHRVLGQFLKNHAEFEGSALPFGTVWFPRLRRGETVEQLCRLLREKYDTSVVPGKFFGMPEHIRVGLGCKTEVFAEGIHRLGLALAELSDQGIDAGSTVV